MKAKLLVLGAAALCAACAILPEQVEVGYTPDATISRARVAAADVQLHVADSRRAESPAWIADKKNSYGMRLASVVAQRPVADLVKDAVAQELTLRGVRVGATGATVAVEISRLESVYQIRFFSIGAIGYADFAVQVRRADGTVAYARTFSISNDDEAQLAGTAGQARRSVETALSKVVGQVVADPAFMKAVTEAQRSALST